MPSRTSDPSPDALRRAQFLRDAAGVPELDSALRAFEAGNYALVRKEAARVIAETRDPSARQLAEELLRRIQPDPLVKLVLVVSFCLLLFVTLFAYLH